MRLRQLRLKNFRCYDELIIDFEDITALIGRNDAGKSSVMEALDILLNDGLPDRHDAKKGGDGTIVISATFDSLPDAVTIDDSVPTTFAREMLLDGNGQLQIRKTFSGAAVNPKCTGVFAVAVHPSAKGVEDLLQLKNADLKKRAKELKVDLAGVDAKVNYELRQRIREHVGQLDSKLQVIPLNEENGRKAWEGIKVYLPAFALFKSDRPSTDQDPEAQDPLKAAVKEAVKQKESELAAVFKHVEESVRKIADETVAKLKELDASLATSLSPQFAPPKWDTLFKASITGDNEIPINKRGSGVRRLILLSFFRAKAAQQAKDRFGSRVIYGIEEPETSQHPHNQRMLLRALTEISVRDQVVISTHTPMLARSLPETCLRFIRKREDERREVLTGSDETNRLIAKSLGVLGDNGVRLFVGVEGKHDISFLRNASQMLRKEGQNVLDLERMELDGELIFFPLGGQNLAVWSTRLENLHRPEFHLYDRDTEPPVPAKYQAEADAVNQRPECRARITGRRTLENYVHMEAINEALRCAGINIEVAANYGAYEDVPRLLCEHINQVAPTHSRWSPNRVKEFIAEEVVSRMTLGMLLDVDPDGDLLTWFSDMKDLAIGAE